VKRLAALIVLLGLAPPARAEPPPLGGAPAAGDPIQADQLSKPPVLVKEVAAEYPPDALARKIEADVVLLLDIDAEGKVQAVGIAEPATPAGMGFDEAAMVAAQQFEFTPAELDGQKIAVQITYRTRFRLPVEAPPEEPAPSGGAAPPPPTAARQINFAGVLRERGTRTPIAGVTVTIFRDDGAAAVGFEAVSDQDGAFVFYDLAPGTWKILAEPPGYYPLKTSEEVIAGQRTDATYLIERGSYNPFDVMVTAPRPRKEVSRTVLAAAEIDKVPGTAGDPLAVVQNFAGVARAFGGQLIVRGSAPEDSRVFVDGAEIPLIYHFGGLKSVIPVGILDSIEFYPGNFSPMYGRATGGVVDVRLKEIKPKKLGGYADVSILDTGVFLEVPLGDKGGIAVAGRRSYIDAVILAAVPDSASVDLLTAPRYYDLQLLGNYRPRPEHDLRAFLIGSDDRLEILFQNPADLDPSLEGNVFSASSSFYRSLFTYRFVPNEHLENTLRISNGRNWLDFRAGQLIFDLGIYAAQIRDTIRHRFSDRYALSYGIDVLYGKVDALIRLPRPVSEGQPVENQDLDDTVTTRVTGATWWSPAFFAEGELEPIAGLTILPGLRADVFERTGEAVAQPRLTARWKLSDLYTVKGGLGLFAQEPDFGETDDNFGNPDLQAERAIHGSAGVEWKPLPHITLDATGFYKHMTRLVSPTDALIMVDGETRPQLYDNRGRGRVYGLELVARHEVANRFSGWVAYTLSRARRRDGGSDEMRLFDFDQTHILTAVASYLLPRNWQIGARFRLVSGNPMTPVVGSVFNASSDRYDPIYGPVNSDRNPPFHQLDLRVDKRWIYRSWILNAYIDIQNLYNRANPEGLQYNFDFSETAVQQGLPLVTIFGLRAEF
jgi:TonB family protein